MKKGCTRDNDHRKSPELHRGSRTILLAMKITTILLFVTCLQVGAKGYSQKVTLNERKGSFEKVLQQIEKQSGYVFWYEDRLLLKANPVDIALKNTYNWDEIESDSYDVLVSGQTFEHAESIFPAFLHSYLYALVFLDVLGFNKFFWQGND